MRSQKKSEGARRGAARAARERDSLREHRHVQWLERKGRAPKLRTSREAPAYEAEVVPGLERFAREELRELLGSRVPVRSGSQSGTLSFPMWGDPRALMGLGTVTAVYRVQPYEVPRPRALLGEEQLQSMVKLIRGVLSTLPEGSFQSFRFSAAGARSGVFARLAAELERRTGLAPDAEEGDLLIRVRRSTAGIRDQESGVRSRASTPAPARTPHPIETEPEPDQEERLTPVPRPLTSVTFEVLVRLTPRPLSARAWRVCDMPGALNATVARVMAMLTAPAPQDRYLNLMCGSGTLMIERLALGPAWLVLGGDRDSNALRCARENLKAAGADRQAVLAQWDVRRLPLEDASVNVLTADLPYGMLMGSRRENERLYPELLGEATRVAAPRAAMVLITHAARTLDQALQRHQEYWTTEQRFPVEIPYRSGVLKPQVVLLRRTGRRVRE